jgi:hypothetical protein
VQPQGIFDVLIEGQVDRRPLPLDVGARAEARALAGEHHGTDVVADRGKRLEQLADELGVEGVAPLGPGERDTQNIGLPLDAQRCHPGAS